MAFKIWIRARSWIADSIQKTEGIQAMNMNGAHTHFNYHNVPPNHTNQLLTIMILIIPTYAPLFFRAIKFWKLLWRLVHIKYVVPFSLFSLSLSLFLYFCYHQCIHSLQYYNNDTMIFHIDFHMKSEKKIIISFYEWFCKFTFTFIS